MVSTSIHNVDKIEVKKIYGETATDNYLNIEIILHDKDGNRLTEMNIFTENDCPKIVYKKTINDRKK